MRSFVFEPSLKASAWIARLSSGGMRRSTTGLEPGSGLLRPEGANDTPKRRASIPVATSLREPPWRAISRTRAPFNGKGILTRTPLRSRVLAAKVLAV